MKTLNFKGRIFLIIFLCLSHFAISAQLGKIYVIEPQSFGYNFLDSSFLQERMRILPDQYKKHIEIRSDGFILDVFECNDFVIRAYVSSYIYKIQKKKNFTEDICLYYKTLRTSSDFALKIYNLIYKDSVLILTSQDEIESWNDRFIHCNPIEVKISFDEKESTFIYDCIGKQNQSIVPINLLRMEEYLADDEEIVFASRYLDRVLEKGFIYTKDKYHLRSIN